MTQQGGPSHKNADRIHGSDGRCIEFKIIDIGDWDMNADASKAVIHGLDANKIRVIKAVIRNDSNDGFYPLMDHDGAAAAAMVNNIDNININMARANGLDFDNINFNSTSYNRGWIFIIHEIL